MTLTTKLDLYLAMEEVGSSLDFGTPICRLSGGNLAYTQNGAGLDGAFAESQYHSRRETPDGSAAGYADLRWSDQRTLGPAGSETLDLAGGSLIGDFGPVDFGGGHLSYLIVSSIGGSLTISRPANGVPFFTTQGDSITIQDQGLVILCSPRTQGAAVTAGTGDLIEITAGASGCTYDIHLIGRSA